FRNCIGDSDILAVAAYKYIEIVRLLLKFKVVQDNVAKDNNAALQSAAQGGNVEIVRLLLQFQKVQINIAICQDPTDYFSDNSIDNYALYSAALYGRLDVVRELMTYEAVREKIATNNNRAFIAAVSGKHIDVVIELLQYQ